MDTIIHNYNIIRHNYNIIRYLCAVYEIYTVANCTSFFLWVKVFISASGKRQVGPTSQCSLYSSPSHLDLLDAFYPPLLGPLTSVRPPPVKILLLFIKPKLICWDSLRFRTWFSQRCWGLERGLLLCFQFNEQLFFCIRTRKTPSAPHPSPHHPHPHRLRPSGSMDVVGVKVQAQRSLSGGRRPEAQAGLLWWHQHGDTQPWQSGQ